jgi:hypothetical protein
MSQKGACGKRCWETGATSNWSCSPRLAYFFTVMVAVPVTPLAVALMVAVPSFRAVTFPLLETVATCELLVSQVKVLLCVLP